MGGRVELAPKYAAETKTYTFDFTSQLGSATISTEVLSASVYSGVDASPNIFNGSPSASGAIVSQSIMAGVEGVIYQITCQITTSDSQTLDLTGYLAIVPKLV